MSSRNQAMQVKCFSNLFTVTNGVRPGSVFSPHVFAACLDEFSVNLGSTKAGILLEVCL